MIPIDFAAMKTENGVMLPENAAENNSYMVVKMANKKQLAILKQGVAAWNKWREANPDAKINLRGAKMNGLNLTDVNLSKADIRGAKFRKALLKRADFSHTKNGRDFQGKFMIFILSIINSFPSLILILLTCLFLLTSSVQTMNSYLFVAPFAILLGAAPAAVASIFIYATPLSGMISTISSFILIIAIFNEQEQYTNDSYLYLSIFNLIQSVAIVYYIVCCMKKECTTIFFLSCLVTKRCPLSVSIYKKLTGSIFFRTDILRRIGLIGSTLFGTDFREADLTCAIFNNAKLKHVRFGNAILNGTYFMYVNGLQLSRCTGTILEDRDVRELLVRGNGHGLSLKGKKLQGAHLVNADLRGLDLQETDLMQANLSGADITGAKLYGSARENWIIDGIRCDYVYWDEAVEQRTPPDRDFRPGEFEELYKQLPTFEYIFEQGFTPLDPLIMDRVVQAVNERHKEFSLELVNFDKRGQPHATFTVCHLEHVEKAKQQIAAGYEESRIAPDQREQLMAAVLGLIENQNKLIDKIPSSRGQAMGDNYYISGGQIAAVGTNASASNNTFQQITAELSRLHEEMQRSAKTTEQRAAAEDVAKAAQAAREQNEPALLQHLKNAGKFAFDCAKTVGTDVAAEFLKKAMGI